MAVRGHTASGSPAPLPPGRLGALSRGVSPWAGTVVKDTGPHPIKTERSFGPAPLMRFVEFRAQSLNQVFPCIDHLLNIRKGIDSMQSIGPPDWYRSGE